MCAFFIGPCANLLHVRQRVGGIAPFLDVVTPGRAYLLFFLVWKKIAFSLVIDAPHLPGAEILFLNSNIGDIMQ